jgi:8-oxo-dGTP pyrophosphatase MutT (NUDIX family)
MAPTTDIHKSAGIIIKNRKLLVEKDFDKEFFVAPGGKLEPGETSRECLVRELKEEFLIEVKPADLEEFGTFSAPASGQEHRIVHMQTFMVKKWRGRISKGHKVEKLLWLTSQIPSGSKIGSIFAHEVVPRLKSQNLID